MIRNAGLALVVAIGTVMVWACTPPNIAGEPLKGVTTGEAFDGVKCSAVRPQNEPDLMAWDPASRANLSRLRGDGIVAVRYEVKGCNVELELLSHCIGTGKYKYSAYSANETKIARNANELFAELPLGAANLSGKLKGNRALRTDYMLVGTSALPTGTSLSAADLRGAGCERATHVVSVVYVGGFTMAAGESREIEATGSLFHLKAGGASTASVERLANEGSPQACENAQAEGKENVLCAVPLRVGLLPLRPAAAAAAAASAPAAPLAAGVQAAALPSVPPPPKALQGVALGADPDALVGYDAAMKADAAGRGNPAAAVAAWHKLSLVQGNNPYKPMAAEREMRWAEFAEAKKVSDVQRGTDLERLTKVLPLESIPEAQKEAMINEYARLYGGDEAWTLIQKVALPKSLYAKLFAQMRFTREGDVVRDRHGGTLVAVLAAGTNADARAACAERGPGWKLPNSPFGTARVCEALQRLGPPDALFWTDQLYAAEHLAAASHCSGSEGLSGAPTARSRKLTVVCIKPSPGEILTL